MRAPYTQLYVHLVWATWDRLVTHEITPDQFFKWQGAYGAFTLCKDEVSPVRNYIERQREHHAKDDLWADWEQTATAEDESEAER